MSPISWPSRMGGRVHRLKVAGGSGAEVSTARRIYLDLQVMDGWMVQVQKRGKRKGEVRDVEKKGQLYVHTPARVSRMPG